MYGYRRGSELASQLEQIFRALPPSQPDLITPLTVELREDALPGQLLKKPPPAFQAPGATAPGFFRLPPAPEQIS